jgi:hypothetical protein
MVECDIRVPDKWPSYFQHPTMTPYEYFEEMVPLFCTTDVPFDLTGEHMQDHVQRFELSEKPRQLLVGGMRGDRCYWPRLYSNGIWNMVVTTSIKSLNLCRTDVSETS